MRSYATARNIYSLMEVIAWCSVAAGVVAALAGADAASGFSRSGGLMGALPGLIMATVGIFLVGSVQSGRANVDSAEYGQQMLKIARDQLEVSKQGLKKSSPAAQSFEALKPDEKARPEPSGYAQPKPQEIKPAQIKLPKSEHQEFQHGGQTIVKRGGLYFVGEMSFPKLLEAELHIMGLNRATPAPEKLKAAEVETPAIKFTPEPIMSRPPKKKEIVEEDGKFLFGNMVFGTREKAEAYASQLGINPNVKPNV